MKLVIRPVRLPADLATVKPGFLPEYLLKPIRPYGRLYPLAAQAWEAMRKAAHADGIRPFKPTSSGDTYRDYATQLRTFHARYTTAPIDHSKSVRMFLGEKYYLKPGLAPVALPGTSLHNYGLAVDVSDASALRLAWMFDNIHKYGFCWELQSEPWHIRYYVAEAVPTAVTEWIRSHSDGSY